MAFFKWLFGRKKEEKRKAESARQMEAEEIYEDESEFLKPIEEIEEKAPRRRKTKTAEPEPIADAKSQTKSAEAEATTEPSAESAPPKKPQTTKEKTAPKADVKEEAKNEEKIEEKTVEEIDASFNEAENAKISEEVAKAEKKSGHALARFEIKKAKDGRFVFNLFAPNRVIVATSQIYSSSASAVNGIKSIAVNAPKAPIEDTSLKSFTPLGFPKWEIYVDKGGQYRFRLYAPNGSCIVHSQGYTSKASCKNGIASIVKNAPDAIIDKSYLKKDEN